ncbi:MAG TPA: Gfo/Idh/MocA family oxidoreductase [Gemmatimonadaceae bacterium]
MDESRFAQTTSPASPLRVGILGAGQMARHHARAIARLGSAKLSAAVDPDSSALAEMSSIGGDIATFASLDELIRSKKVDVLHICTPPQTHEELAERALEAGLHIYVEKPFVETSAAAKRLAALADSKSLKICAGHQLLYEPPTVIARQLLPSLGELTHIESYFSFRAMRHSPNGRAPLRDDLQLLDILPHPVYLLLDFLERSVSGTTRAVSVEIGARGTVHALVKRGPLTATLVVTLDGRPVESYLRLVGTNGSVYADYVRGTVQRNIGPGASGIDKLISPYRQASQLLTGTTSAMYRRLARRQRSYPGLAEIFGEFYESIRQNRSSPVSRANLVETVAICEQIGSALRTAHLNAPRSIPRARTAPVVVTGGTGFLGKEVVRALLAVGEEVRVIARRTPPDWEKIPGVSYVVADISQPIPADVMAGAKAVVHCAAETAGGWDQHRRNSIEATGNVLTATAAAQIERIIHISSISVLAVPRRGESLTDNGPLEPSPRSGGPYAWGKLESEKLAVARSKELGLDLRIVRPSALVDYRAFDPPGLLGKRLGNVFVAVGMPGQRLGVVDVVFSAQTIAWMVRNFSAAPRVMNLFEPELPTKRELLTRLRASNPDLGEIWLLPVMLHPLSWFAILLQKTIHPRKPAISVAKIFSRLRYDTSTIARLAPIIRADAEQAHVEESLPTQVVGPNEPVFEAIAPRARQLA